jgi:hypothetical protein
MAEDQATGSERRIVLYSKGAEAPADARAGEVLPVIRGDGPREGDLMGLARITGTEDGLEFVIEPAEQEEAD